MPSIPGSTTFGAFLGLSLACGVPRGYQNKCSMLERVYLDLRARGCRVQPQLSSIYITKLPRRIRRPLGFAHVQVVHRSPRCTDMLTGSVLGHWDTGGRGGGIART